MFNALTLAAVLTGSAATSLALLPPVTAPPSVSENPPIVLETQPEPVEVAIREAAPEKPKEKRLVCKSCNVNEQIALKKLQDYGIKDRNALATIMGNIRQESTFVPDVCEGGARTGYHGCRSGGFGLIQWTSEDRYLGLGQHARRTGGDPSSIHTQMSYLFHEGDWKMIENNMMTPGKTIDDYMRLARRWIRWGHHGARTAYAHDYARRLTSDS
jgi:hypothetical protein